MTVEELGRLALAIELLLIDNGVDPIRAHVMTKARIKDWIKEGVIGGTQHRQA